MAYANLISQSCNNPIESFCRFRDFVCKRNATYDYSTTGIGWTLVDSDYTGASENVPGNNNWFVIYSDGEDGLRDLYYKFTLKNSGYIDVIGYLYWNSSTQTGTQLFGAIYNWTTTWSTNNILYIFGDLDAIFGITQFGTNYFTCHFGWMPDSPISQDIINYSSAITAGGSVELTFSSVPSEWAVNTKLFVWDNTNIELVNISAIDGNDVTFTNIASSYASGADFSMERTNFVQHGTSMAYYALLISHSGTKNDASCIPVPTWLTNPTSGDGLTGLYPAQKTNILSATTLMGPFKNSFTTLNSFTNGSAHTIGSTDYTYFNLFSSRSTLIKTV